MWPKSVCQVNWHYGSYATANVWKFQQPKFNASKNFLFYSPCYHNKAYFKFNHTCVNTTRPTSRLTTAWSYHMLKQWTQQQQNCSGIIIIIIIILRVPNLRIRYLHTLEYQYSTISPENRQTIDQIVMYTSRKLGTKFITSCKCTVEAFFCLLNCPPSFSLSDFETTPVGSSSEARILSANIALILARMVSQQISFLIKKHLKTCWSVVMISC